MKVRLDIEYLGEAFSGWQRQEGQTTVQGELETALRILTDSLAKKAGVPQVELISVTGSGRTDAGVHALQQVASFSWPELFEFNPQRILNGLNALTPREMVVKRISTVPDQFDARLTPHTKRYEYRLLLRRFSSGFYKNKVWCVDPNLDIERMVQAARYFKGQHDFSSFRAIDCGAMTTIRTIENSELVRVSDEELIFIIEGKGFLKQMVRIIVGTLVAVGERRIAPSDIPKIIGARDREQAGVTAPAEGLTLVWVRYEEELV